MANPPDRGYFIVLEGIDGSGSSTQCQRLADFLRQKTRSKVLVTSEPSSGPAGMLIRLALGGRLSGPNTGTFDEEHAPPAFTPLDVHTLALLFAADRTDHLETQILPALRKGHHVVCDRYILSSLAYQGLQIDLDWLLAINRHAVRPDLTLFLDVPPQHTRLRMRHSRISKELFEETPQQEEVQKKYREVIAAHLLELGPVHTLDASRLVDLVEKEVVRIVKETLFDSTTESPGELALL